MSNAELTRQQLDPAGTLGAFAPTVVIAMLAAGWTVCVTFLSAGDRNTPLLDGATLSLIALVALLFVRSADPLRAPFTSLAHLLIHAGILAAFALHAAATWAEAYEPSGGWGPFTLGAMMLALGPYRPARELVTFGTASAVAMAAVTVLKATTLQAPVLPAVAAIIPALALSYGSARYSGGLVRMLDSDRVKSNQSAVLVANELRSGISRAVRDDRVTILDRDVTPFFIDLIASGKLTDEDRHRARGIAQSIREIMVADANRSWLQVAIAGLSEPHRQQFSIFDPQLVAPAATSGQRTALRAFIVALDSDSRVEAMVLRLSADGGHPKGLLTLQSKEAKPVMRNRYDPYFAVMQIAFPEFTVEVRRHTIIVRFGFDHS